MCGFVGFIDENDQTYDHRAALRHHACRPAVENLEKLVTSKLAI